MLQCLHDHVSIGRAKLAIKSGSFLKPRVQAVDVVRVPLARRKTLAGVRNRSLEFFRLMGIEHCSIWAGKTGPDQVGEHGYLAALRRSWRKTPGDTGTIIATATGTTMSTAYKVIIEDWDGGGAIRIPDGALQKIGLDVGDSIYLLEEFIGNSRCLVLSKTPKVPDRIDELFS